MKKTFSILIASSILLAGCSPYMYSYKRNNENVAMYVNRNPNGIIETEKLTAQNTTDNRGRFGFLAALQPIGMAVFKGLMALLSAEEKKYNQEYAVTVSEGMFYNEVSEIDAFDSRGMGFEGFDLVRTFQEKKSNIRDTACHLKFSVDLSNPYDIVNNSVFRLNLSGFDYKYSKAKIANLPNAEKRANLDVNIVVKATWTTATGAVHYMQEIGKMHLYLRDIPMDPADSHYMEYRQKVIGTQLEGYCSLVPRSYGHYQAGGSTPFKSAFGTGDFTIEVKAVESGRMGKMQKVIFSQIKLAKSGMPK